MTGRESIRYRWLVVFGACIIQIALGSIYAWSVFTYSLQNAPFQLSTVQVQSIFSVSLLSFTIFSIFSSIRMKKKGFRLFLIVGGLALTNGYIWASQQYSSFPLFFISSGIMSGAGIGLAYGIPLAVSIKWFPDKKNFITGLMISAFALGTLLWVQAGGPWLNLVEKLGINEVFRYYGITLGVLFLIGLILLKKPPMGYTHENYTTSPVSENSDKMGRLRIYTWQKMLNKPVFWVIWLIFVVNGMAAFMIIGSIQLIGIDTLKSYGFDIHTACTAAGNAMTAFAFFYAAGAILWNKIGKIFGASGALFLMTFVQGVLMLSFLTVAKNPILLAVYASVIGFCFGGSYSLFHTSTVMQFGAKNVKLNYLFVFSAYGIAGIASPVLSGYIKDFTGIYNDAFILIGVLCILGSLLAFTIKQPTERRIGGRRAGEKQTEQTDDQNVDTGQRKILGSRKSSDRRTENGIHWSHEGYGYIADIPD